MAGIIFNVAAKCDKAGRKQNEDDFWVCPDLSRINDQFGDLIGCDKDVEMSDKGALLVVADGMGGMNAGEVASELVIKGVQKGFANIPDEILGDDEKMLSFVRKVIIDADQSVKDHAKTHREAKGMGSTIVLLWLYEEKAYCGWCGDSRIYRYNPNNSLVRLSHDHSYVQELVDSWKIEPEEAFDHPDGNIITRCLGDSGEKADPETRVYDICERDTFLLCSDGLCGLVQDKDIEEIVSLNCSSTKDALAALWRKGDEEGWSDNATIELLYVISGGKRPKGVAVGYPEKKRPAEQNREKKEKKDDSSNRVKDETFETGTSEKNIKVKYLLYVMAVAALVILGIILFKTCSSSTTESTGNGDGNNFTYEAAPNPDDGRENMNYDDQQNNNTQQGVSLNNNGGGRPGRGNGANNGNIVNSNGPGNNTQQQNNPPVLDDNETYGADNLLHPTSYAPSQDYMNLFGSVKDDYKSVYDLWSRIKRDGYMKKDDMERLKNYEDNVADLLNQPDYQKLDTQRKQYIDNKLKPLYRDIQKNKKKYKNFSSTNNGSILDHDFGAGGFGSF